jgi:hypothetical protein
MRAVSCFLIASGTLRIMGCPSICERISSRLAATSAGVIAAGLTAVRISRLSEPSSPRTSISQASL